MPWLVAAAVFIGACSDDPSDASVVPLDPPLARGDLLGLTPLGASAPEEVAAYLANFEIDTSAVRFGVEAYRIEYRTIDPEGGLVRASALLALPRDDESALEQVAWMHGTTVYRGEAASVNEASDARAAAFFFASAGYATTAPDYLGLGLGEGLHPYDHIPSEVTAGIDALRATRKAAEKLARRLDPTLSISGHSQGGPAAVAMGREIQSGGGDGLVLAHLAPISGPYDMAGSLATAARGGIAYAAAYLAYLTVAWNRWLHLYTSPSDAFMPPYDQTVERLFDNEHTTEEVFTGLPETVEELFTPAFLERLREPSGALRTALADASEVCAWRPEVTVTVYASSGDADVPIDNAYHCVDSFRRSGAEVRLVDLGEWDHSAAMTVSLPLVLAELVDAAPPRR